MATRHRTFTFASTDIDGIADEMALFGTASDGRRWMNIVPDANEDEIHTGTLFWRVFSSRGPVIPQVTWVPQHEGRNGLEPAQLGVAHATGRRALDRLADRGVRPPPGFQVIQDHQKRGVVFVLEAGVDNSKIVEFAMGAIRELSPFDFEDAYMATFSQQ
ncbi:MAG: hypothetical protein ACR2PK_04260 [Acidimicrobiales bacterium]